MYNRDLNLDYLKVFAAFAVVCLHVSVVVVHTNPDIDSHVWWVGNVIDSFTRWCVPIFVMVSGALLLSRSSDSHPFEFYRRRMGRLIAPLLFWTFFYLVLSSYENHGFDLILVGKSILQGQPYYHLWYLYMMVGLYIATPFIRQLLVSSSEYSINILIIICFIISSIESSVGILENNQPRTFLGLFLPFLAYFVAGYHLRNISIGISLKALIITAMASGTLIALGTGVLLPALGHTAWHVMYNYLNPLVIIMSLCIFTIVVKHRFRSKNLTNVNMVYIVSRLAPLTLGVYLIHPFWLKVLGHFGVNGLYAHPFFGVPLTSIVIFVLSVISIQVLMSIPFLRATVR